MIKESGISKQDQAKNAQAIIDVIGFLTETQEVNEEDHAFSKFTQFETAYVEQLGADQKIAPTTILPLDSPAPSPKLSPSLPKRPTSPNKPPRKGSMFKTSKTDLTKATANVEPQIIRKPSARNHQSLPPPRRGEKTSILPPGTTPIAESEPPVAAAPISVPMLSATPAVIPAPAPPALKPLSRANSRESVSRPPVPARPAHTLGIHSTDVKQSIIYSPASVPNVSVAQKAQQFEQPFEPPKVVPPKPSLEPAKTAKPQIRARPKPATSTKDIVDKIQAICNPADPTRLYRNLVKIGQG